MKTYQAESRSGRMAKSGSVRGEKWTRVRPCLEALGASATTGQELVVVEEAHTLQRIQRRVVLRVHRALGSSTTSSRRQDCSSEHDVPSA